MVNGGEKSNWKFVLRSCIIPCNDLFDVQDDAPLKWFIAHIKMHKATYYLKGIEWIFLRNQASTFARSFQSITFEITFPIWQFSTP